MLPQCRPENNEKKLFENQDKRREKVAKRTRNGT